MRLHLQAKVSLLVTLASVVIGVISTLVSAAEQSRDRAQRLIARGTALSYALSKSAEEGFIKEDLRIEKVASYIEAEDVLLAQAFLTTWDAADAHPIDSLKEPPHPDAVGHFMNSKNPFYLRADAGYDFYQPIFMPGTSPPSVIGFVRVMLSDAYILSDIKRQLLQSGAVSGGMTLLAIIIFNALIGGFIVRPVASLSSAMARYREKGEIPQSPSPRLKDEITDLASEFSRLCATIDEKEWALNEALEKLTIKELALEESEKLYRTIFETSPDDVVVVDLTGKILMCNMRSARMHGYEKAEDMIGKDAFLSFIVPEEKDIALAVTRELAASGSIKDKVFTLFRKDGSRFPVEANAALITDEAGNPKSFLAIIRDITARKKAEEMIIRQSETLTAKNEEISRLYEEVKALSLHDPLTGLANRRYLDIELGRSFAKAKRYGRRLSVIMADIDWFKRHNDTYGHPSGDRLLREIAGIMIALTRESDLVVRYGGEEFLILLHETGMKETFEVAERMRNEVSSKTEATISFGIAEYEKRIKNKDQLISEADTALYRAKKEGRNRTCLFESSIDGRDWA